MSRVIVTPVEGRTVPKENGDVLKPEGERLRLNSWWKRRQRDGDVTIAPDAPAKKGRKPAGEAASKGA